MLESVWKKNIIFTNLILTNRLMKLKIHKNRIFQKPFINLKSDCAINK